MSDAEEAIKRKYAANAEGDAGYESYGVVNTPPPPVAKSSPQPPRPASADVPVPVVSAVAAVSLDRSTSGMDTASVQQDTVRVPDHFCRFLCCACTCSNCEFPGCFGCKQSGTFLCLDGYHACCKPIKDPVACCICAATDNECVVPTTLCKRYDQCCCWECFCAFPSVDDGYRHTAAALANMPSKKDGTGLLNDVTICVGGCCTISSCNCKIPECLGCYTKGVCLCQEMESMCCKMMCWDETKLNKDTLCIISKGNNLCVMPYTCCKSVDQCCCCDMRRACPCDDEVPCIYTGICFCTCCVNGACNVTCCATINEVLGQRNPPLMANTANSSSHGGTVTAQPM